MPVINPFPTYASGTFTPTPTLVGGAGNTTPVYTTNTGLYVKVGNMVTVDVYLNGDGGNEGAGTGQINIALPFTASSTSPSGNINIGTALNNTTTYFLIGEVAASATTVTLSRVNVGTLTAFTGADQNNATRTIRLKFSYTSV